MNSINSPLLSEATDGLAPLSASDLASSSSSRFFVNLPEEMNDLRSSRFISRRLSLCGVLMTVSCCGMLAPAYGEDITTDIANTGESSITGIKYEGSASIGTISSRVSGTATNNTGVGIYTNGDMSIGKITVDALISGVAGYNTAYGLQSASGNIVIQQVIDGTISARAGTSNVKGKPAIGIYSQKGDIVMEGISSTGSVSVFTDTAGQAKAVQAQKNLTMTGALAGTISSNSNGTLGYGLWASSGTMSLGSVADTGSITVNANFNARAMQAAEGITIYGAMDGAIAAHSNGNFAYGIYGNSNNSTIRGNVSIGSMGEGSSITVGTDTGHTAVGITSAYGYVTVGDMRGTISASSGSTSTTDRLSSFGISSMWGTTLGNLGEKSSIRATSSGADAFGIFTGKDGGANNVNGQATIKVGNIGGAVMASAVSGVVGAIYAENRVTIGDVASGAVISASSTGNADVYGLYSGYLLNTGVINGTVSAQTSGNYAFAMMGNGITATIGENGVVFAKGAESSDKVYAIFSGSYQQGFMTSQNYNYFPAAGADRQLEIYNVEDSLSFHAGAQVNGIIEMGGSGEKGKKDTLNLLGGTSTQGGTFDYDVRTTINKRVMNPPSDNQYSFVQLNVGTDSTPAFWEIKGQEDLFDDVRVNAGSIVTVNDASLTPREGGRVLNMGTIIGTGSLSIGNGMSLITGALGMNESHTELVSVGTGLGSGLTVTIDKGASLGTSVVNTTGDAWIITQEQIDSARNDLFAGLIGKGYSEEDYIFTYFLKGQVYLGNGSPIVTKPGTAFIVGEGAEVTLGENLPTNGFVLEGGKVDVSASSSLLVSSDHKISGSSGTLVMGENQELVLDQSQNIGYSVTARNSSAGKLTVTGQGNVIHASGDYNVKTASIENGATLSIEGGSLGSSGEGSVIQVGGEYTSEKNPASLLLHNAIVKSELNIGANSLLKGTGVFEKAVNLFSNNVYVGNSPGVMDFKGGLVVKGVSDFTFYVEGFNPGEYSSMKVSDKLEWSFSHVNVELGDKLMLADSDKFSLVLIDASQVVNPEGLEDGVSLDIAKNKELLSDSFLAWNEESRQLVFSGELNRQAIDTRKMREASSLANALWSSTRSVSNFARVAASQLDGPRNGRANIWMAGLGDFASAGSDGSTQGFDYKGGGYAIGADYVLKKGWTGGFSLGQTFGTNEASDTRMKIKQDAVMSALYARYFHECSKTWDVFTDFYAAFGNVSNTADGATLSGESSRAKWDDSVASFGARFNGSWKVGERSVLIPFAGIDFVNGRQEAFSQSYGEGTNSYFAGKMQTWSIPLGLTWKTNIDLGGTQMLTPEVTVSYVGDVDRRSPRLKSISFGDQLNIKGVNPGRNAFIGSAGLRWTLNASWNVGAYYDVECRSGMTNQGVNASVHYSF